MPGYLGIMVTRQLHFCCTFVATKDKFEYLNIHGYQSHFNPESNTESGFIDSLYIARLKVKVKMQTWGSGVLKKSETIATS